MSRNPDLTLFIHTQRMETKLWHYSAEQLYALFVA